MAYVYIYLTLEVTKGTVLVSTSIAASLLQQTALTLMMHFLSLVAYSLIRIV